MNLVLAVENSTNHPMSTKFQVNVTLLTDKGQPKVQPGKKVQLNVQSTPNSYIGLLAVDRGAWLQGDGNQITTQRVLNEIKAFSDGIEGTADDVSIKHCYV